MKLILHCVYWILIFTPGLVDLMDWPSGIYRAGFPLVGATLFSMTLIQNKPTVKVPLFFPVLAFLGISIASGIYNDQPLYNLVYFLLYTVLLSYLYFLNIVNECDDKLVSRVGKFIIILVLLQIPVVLIKYQIMGQTESGAIGTLSTRAGSISTVFPALVVAFLTSFYFYTRKNVYLFLIIMFALFGIIGGKRAIVVFLPAEMFLGYILYMLYNRTEMSRKMVGNALIVSLVSALVVCLTIKTVPTLNPEHSNWGSVDLEHVLEYTEDYTDSGYLEGESGATLQEIRRIEGLQYFVNLLLDYDYMKMMLGDGAGNLVKSKYADDSGDMIDVYGVRYGGRMGFIWLLMQVGILGVAAHLCFYVLIVWKIHSIKSLPDRYHEALKLGFILASAFMFLDFMIYSVISTQLEAVKGLYLFVGALLYRRAYYAQNWHAIVPQGDAAMIYARN